MHDIVRISKYKNIFEKGYTPNWLEEVCVIKKVKNTVSRIYVLDILTEKNLLERFTKKIAKKTNQKEFRVEKVIKRKGQEIYLKWRLG